MRLFLSIAVLLLGATAASAQPVSDYRLPPDPDSTPSSRPQAQGPTDLEGETRSAPRVIETQTPTPRPTASAQPTSAPSPTPSATASPRPAATASSGPALPASDGPVSTREVLAKPAPRPAASEPDGGLSSDSAVGDTDIASGATQPEGLPSPGSASGPANEAENTASVAAETSLPEWIWPASIIAILLALAAILLAMIRHRLTRRREAAEARDTAEAAEPVGVVDMSGPPMREISSQSYPASADAGSLEVEAFAVTLSRSVMNASISYRVTMVNRGSKPIELIQVHGDLTTAHGSIPAAQQLADTEQAFPELHRLDPGQRSTMQGELRLPLREVRALRQGSVPVFVPLLRMTVRAANMEPRAYTYVIGTRPADKGARPNPFRLDEPPRSYAKLSTRALA